MKPKLSRNELVSFHAICDRNGIREGRGEWIYELEKIIADAAFDSLPGEDGTDTVVLSQRAQDRLTGWQAGLERTGDDIDLDVSIRDFVMVVVVHQMRSGLTGARFSWPTGHHERKMRNANSSTYKAKRERRADKRGHATP